MVSIKLLSSPLHPSRNNRNASNVPSAIVACVHVAAFFVPHEVRVRSARDTQDAAQSSPPAPRVQDHSTLRCRDRAPRNPRSREKALRTRYAEIVLRVPSTKYLGTRGNTSNTRYLGTKLCPVFPYSTVD